MDIKSCDTCIFRDGEWRKMVNNPQFADAECKNKKINKMNDGEATEINIDLNTGVTKRAAYEPDRGHYERTTLDCIFWERQKKQRNCSTCKYGEQVDEYSARYEPIYECSFLSDWQTPLWLEIVKQEMCHEIATVNLSEFGSCKTWEEGGE